jgi:hypothetical protein
VEISAPYQKSCGCITCGTMRTISVDLVSIEQCRSGSITGCVCLESEGTRFPEPGWSDFPVVILAWWLETLEGPEPLLRFMDGPFTVMIDRQAKCAHFMRGETPIETRVGVDVEDLQRSVQSAARSVIDRCDLVGISGADVDTLRRRIEQRRADS